MRWRRAHGQDDVAEDARYLLLGPPANYLDQPGGNGIPAATVPPDGLGDDPALNQYAQSCYDGDMQACDDLYDGSEVGSRYETYGGTCAGRQPESNLDTVYCTDAFPA